MTATPNVRSKRYNISWMAHKSHRMVTGARSTRRRAAGGRNAIAARGIDGYPHRTHV